MPLLNEPFISQLWTTNMSQAWTQDKKAPIPFYYLDSQALTIEIWFDKHRRYWRWASFNNNTGDIITFGKASNLDNCMAYAKKQWHGV
jgi:hypothetical protein